MSEEITIQNMEKVAILPDKSDIVEKKEETEGIPKRVIDPDKIEEKEEAKAILEEALLGEKKDTTLGRVKTGINGFDDLIDGGFERDSMVLVVGFIGWSLFVCIIQAENKRLLRGMGRY